MERIEAIGEKLGIDPSFIMPQGHYKAKISLGALTGKEVRGKLIVVTGMTPTRAGEGKTTTTIGLTQGLGAIGKNAVATLREPSLGPIFGIKGGGTGGGAAQVVPEEEINIHFTGDAHAVGSAHNLLASLTDNVAQRGQILGFEPDDITWRRVIDVEDRALRSVITGLGGENNRPIRETGFDIVTASEIMAILALSSGLEDLRARLSRVVVGFSQDGVPITAAEVNAVGSMMALLRNAIQPNLVQTIEGQPVLIHAGPFGNIAHGCNSVIADNLALRYSDYVITEAGFGADLGFEKFMHIKARFNDLEPYAAVLVATIRAIKAHGGVPRKDLDRPNPEALKQGMSNVLHLIGMVSSFGMPVVVALNHFPTDTATEIDTVKSMIKERSGHSVIECRGFAEGGSGMIDMAHAIVEATDGPKPNINYLYPEKASIQNKVLALAHNVYSAAEVAWSNASLRQLERYEKLGWGHLPVCMAKTPLSISHDPNLKGHPTGYTFMISDIRASLGAGFIYPIAGSIVTMPGLPGVPRSLDVDSQGSIVGV